MRVYLNLEVEKDNGDYNKQPERTDYYRMSDRVFFFFFGNWQIIKDVVPGGFFGYQIVQYPGCVQRRA